MKIDDALFRPKIGRFIVQLFFADEFETFFPTQGDTPSSFALGWSILAIQAIFVFAVNNHSRINKDMYSRVWRIKTLKMRQIEL